MNEILYRKHSSRTQTRSRKTRWTSDSKLYKRISIIINILDNQQKKYVSVLGMSLSKESTQSQIFSNVKVLSDIVTEQSQMFVT